MRCRASRPNARRGPASPTTPAATPATNFSVLRVKRDIMRRSSVGVLFTNRSTSSVGAGNARTAGIDTTLRLHDLVTLNAYLAKTQTPGRVDKDLSHLMQFQFNG